MSWARVRHAADGWYSTTMAMSQYSRAHRAWVVAALLVALLPFAAVSSLLRADLGGGLRGATRRRRGEDARNPLQKQARRPRAASSHSVSLARAAGRRRRGLWPFTQRAFGVGSRWLWSSPSSGVGRRAPLGRTRLGGPPGPTCLAFGELARCGRRRSFRRALCGLGRVQT